MSDSPHMVFVCLDQLTFRALGAYGNSVIRTPRTDELAREGVTFDRFYSNAPICGPARFAMFAGQRTFSHGDWATPNCPAMRHLPYLGDHMRRAGYATASIGKLHGMPEDFDFGFESVQELGWPRSDYMRWLDERLVGHPEEERIRGLIGPRGNVSQNVGADQVIPEDLSEETWIVEQADRFLTHRSSERPFFLHLGFKHPHPRYETQPREEDVYTPEEVGLPPHHDATEGKPVLDALEEEVSAARALRKNSVREEWPPFRAKYYSCVTQVDRAIGQVVDLLERHGVRDETIVVITADHGDMIGAFQTGGKSTMYEDSVHAPLIMQGPGLPAGVRRQALGEQVDLIPTFLDLAGATIPEHLAGTSLVPAARGQGDSKEAVHSWLVLQGSAQQMTVRGRHKLYRLRGVPNMRPPHVSRQAPDVFELYDLEADPYEMNNIFETVSDEEARPVKEAFCEHFWHHAGVLGCGVETRRRLLGDAAADAFLAPYRTAPE